MKLVSLGTHEVVQVLFLWYIASNKPPLCSALYEVCVTEALPLHPLTIGHEASQPRTHSEHHLVPGADTQDERQLQRLPPP